MFLVDWVVKTRIRSSEFEISICDAKYYVLLVGNIVMFWVCRWIVIWWFIELFSFGFFKWLLFVEWISPRFWLYWLVFTIRNVIEILYDRRFILIRLSIYLGLSGVGIGWDFDVCRSRCIVVEDLSLADMRGYFMLSEGIIVCKFLVRVLEVF